MTFRRALIAFGLLTLAASAHAQTVSNPTPPNSINGAYNAVAPTCSTGLGCWLQTDINGALKVTGSFSATTAATATAAAPSYVEGTSNPLSMDLSGSLRVLATISTAGLATSAKQDTGNTSLATIATNTGAAIPAGSALIGSVGIDQTTPGTTNKVVASVASGGIASGAIASGAVASGAIASGAFASGALASGSVASGAMVDLGAVADAAATQGSTGTVSAKLRTVTAQLNTITTALGGSNAYETVAASQTGQALGATGATGDYLSHCVVYPTTTTPGVVTVFDNTSTAGTNVIAFPGGASSVSNLVPFSVPVGAISTAGAWKVTTGANLVVTCYGRFT